MAKSQDGSRIEAKEAGLNAEIAEDDAVGAHDTHVGHDAHDDAGGGHGADPNAGVVVADAPTPAWVLTAAGIALVTVVVCVIVAVLLNNARV